MRLAKELGIPNVGRMLRSISGRDLIEWMAYAELEPFGEERADLRMGILAALIANVNRDPNKTDEFEPQDFMPKFEEEQKPEVDLVAQKIDAYFSGLAAPLPSASPQISPKNGEYLGGEDNPSPQPSPEGRGRGIET